MEIESTEIVTTKDRLNKSINIGLWIMIAFIYIPVPAFAGTLSVFGLFVLSLYSMNNETRGFALMYFSAPVLGALFHVLHIPLTAYLLCLSIGVYHLRNSVKISFSDIGLVNNCLLLLSIFLLAFLWGPQHAYSISKIVNIAIIGAFSIIYWKVFMNSPNMEIEKLAQCLCLIGLLYIFIAFDFYHFPRPSNLFDFDFFRESFVLLKKKMAMTLSYHSVGIPAMMGLAMMFSIGNLNVLKKKWNIILILPLIIVLLIAQARQAIFGTLLIFLVRIFLDIDFSRSRKIKYAIIVAFMTLILISTIKSEAIEQSMNATSFSRSLNRDYSEAFDIIDTHFVLGNGLGGYSINGERAYPHNLFLELLCELGMVGTMAVSIIVFLPLLLNYSKLKLFTASGFYVFPLLCAVFIKAMMSSDLTENVVVLIALLVLMNNKK